MLEGTIHEALAGRAEQVYGRGLAALFPLDWDTKEPQPTTVTPWPGASYNRTVTPRLFDQDTVNAGVRNPNFVEVDPRNLYSSQPGLQRAAVVYYLGDEWARSGKTYADDYQAGNRYPVVYVQYNGNRAILSGHHRIAAALVQGKPIRVNLIESPEYRDAHAHHAHAVPRNAAAGPGRAQGRDGRRGRGDDRGGRGGRTPRASVRAGGASPVPARGFRFATAGGRRQAAYDDRLIARGLNLDVGKPLAEKIVNGAVTAQDFVRALMSIDKSLGDWWGIMGVFGDLSDFEDYAWGSGDQDLTVKNAWADYQANKGYNPWFGAECQVVLIAKRPVINGKLWDPETDNPDNGLMGNSYLPDSQPLDLVEIRYDAGWGWKSLPATGIRATAAGSVPDDLSFRVTYRGLLDGEAMATASTGGEDVGWLRWDYYAEPPYIVDVEVAEPYQRRGIATALFNWVKANHQSGLVHSQTLTDAGRAWSQHTSATAVQQRPSNDPVEYTHVPPVRHPSEPDERNGGFHSIKAKLDGRQVGYLQWFDPEDGPWAWRGPYVEKVEVATAHRRQGLASEMMRRARQISPGLKHSDQLTNDGRAWRNGESPSEAGTPATSRTMLPRLGALEIPSGVAPGLAADLKRGIEKCNSLGLPVRISQVEFDPNEHPDLAATVRAPGVLVLGPIFADEAKVRARERLWDGLMVDPSVYGTVIHEFGHLVNRKALGTSAYADFVKEWQAASSDGTRNLKMSQEVSVYGADSYTELPAEVFASIVAGRRGEWQDRWSALMATVNVRVGSKTASSLSLENIISVAEEVMERGHQDGRMWDIPEPRLTNFPDGVWGADYRAAVREPAEFVNQVLTDNGHPGGIRLYCSTYDMTGAQAATDGMNYIQVKRTRVNSLTLLHECAHILDGTPEGGHTRGFVATVAGLYSRYISPAAGKKFLEIVNSVSPDPKTAAGDWVTLVHSTRKENLASILEHGFRPGRGEAGYGVYFTPEGHAYSMRGGPDSVDIKVRFRPQKTLLMGSAKDDPGYQKYVEATWEDSARPDLVLAKQGYDSAEYHDPWGDVQYIIFDPTKIEIVSPKTAAKTAGKYDPVVRKVTLGGTEFTLTFDPIRTPWWRSIQATVNGSEAGYLLWGFDNTVSDIGVQKRWQRRGLATAMWNFAKEEVVPDIQHGRAQLPDGKAWIKSLGSAEWVRYHGTSAAAAKSILRDGPRAGLNLTSNPDAARQFARYESGGSAWTTDKRKQGVVLEVRVRPEETKPGDYGQDSFVRDHVVTIVPLPADRVRLPGTTARTAVNDQPEDDYLEALDSGYPPIYIEWTGRNVISASVMRIEVGQIAWHRAGDQLVIDHLVVNEHFQRKGIATELLRRFRARADQEAGGNFDPGAFTADGAAFWKATTGETVPVTRRMTFEGSTTAAAGKFYHSSPVRLQVGTALRASAEPRFLNQVPGKVYFSPDPWVAIAHMKGITKFLDEKAFLYEVEPIGEIEDDPETLILSPKYMGQSFMADDAYVVRAFDLDDLDEVLDVPSRLSPVAAVAEPAGEVRLLVLPKDPEQAVAALQEHLDTAEAPEEPQPRQGRIYPTQRTTYGTWDRDLMHAITKDHGFSFHDHVGDGPSAGYMVSVNKSTEKTVPLADIDPSVVADYMSVHQQELRDPNNYLGGWVYKGNVFLDISRHVDDEQQALMLAKANKQLGIYDLKGNETVMVA